MKEIAEFNLYDFNKAQMAQVKPLDPIWLNRKCETVAKKIMQNGKFWMLLCRERNDYTIFYFHIDVDDAKSNLLETLNTRGQIIDFADKEDGNYEIWIRDFDSEENFVYYLFDYSTGIVEA